MRSSTAVKGPCQAKGVTACLVAITAACLAAFDLSPAGAQAAGGSLEANDLRSSIAANDLRSEVAATSVRPEVVATDVRPEVAYFDSGRPVLVVLRPAVSGRSVVRIEVVSRPDRRVVNGFRRGIRESPVRSRTPVIRQLWAGRTWSGEVAPPGRYSVRVSVRPAGRRATDGPWQMLRWRRAWARGFEYRTHIHPVAGPTGSRGAVGEFGAPRSGGRVHEGHDILAPCGRALLAARGGRVTRAGYDPVLYGHYLEIRGRQEPYSYFYSHLRSEPRFGAGSRVRTGQRVGEVGQTGNAATTPCHLHFEIRRSGDPVDPEPHLDRWSSS